LLGQSLEEAADDPPAGMVLFTTDEAELSLDTVALDVEQRPCDDVLKLLARGVHNSPAINILQGDYSFKQQFDRAWRPWRPAIALAAALVIAVGAGKFMEYRAVASELAEQNAQMEDILRRTFPSIRRVVNPRKQMQSELKKLGAGGGDGFVSVIKQVSDALGSTGNTNLNAISYKTGRLDLDLDTDRISTLDRLKQSLETGGQFSMTIDSANQSKGRIRGRIRVEVRG
jgi:general secretion pathway protein L